MVDIPTSGRPAERPGPPPAASAREVRLAAALRANLRRRKAASKTEPKAAKVEEN